MTALTSTPLPDGFRLQARRNERQPIEAAIAALADGGTLITLSPQRVAIWRVAAGVATDAQGNALASDNIFHARGFDGTVDARWTATAPGEGTLVVLSEDALDPTGDDVSLHGLAARIDDVTYVLLGEPAGARDGWATLSAASFGHLDVPFDSTQRVALRAREYIAFDADGNADVVEEMLLGFTDAGKVTP